jgi:hypothetical protein
MPDLDDPGSAALAADGDLALLQVEVAAAGVVRVVADPGQFAGPIPLALSTAITAASRHWAKAQPWQVLSRADSSPLVNTGTSFSVTFGAQPGHRVRDLLLLSEPSEELLQRPVLVAGIRVAVPGQQMDQPPLHVVAVYLLSPGPGVRGIRWAAANHATASV